MSNEIEDEFKECFIKYWSRHYGHEYDATCGGDREVIEAYREGFKAGRAKAFAEALEAVKLKGECRRGTSDSDGIAYSYQLLEGLKEQGEL